MKISGAIFDMDGTLLDSMFVWEGIGEKYVRSCGAEPEEGLDEIIKNMTMDQVSTYLSIGYGITKPPSEISADINCLIESFYRDVVKPKAGIFDLLEDFKARGVKMCVATATDIHLVKMALSRTGLLPFFSDIFTCTMVGAGKEVPLIFEKALERLGTPKAETPVFEDSLYAIKTAKKAGFPVVGIYDSAWDCDWTEIKKYADYCILDMAVDRGFLD